MENIVIITMFTTVLVCYMGTVLSCPSSISIRDPSKHCIVRGIPIRGVFVLNKVTCLQIASERGPRGICQAPLCSVRSLSVHPFRGRREINVS